MIAMGEHLGRRCAGTLGGSGGDGSAGGIRDDALSGRVIGGEPA